MSSVSWAEYLAGLDQGALAGLLNLRPDVRIEPVPQGFVQLAQRLEGPDSLVAALRMVNRDVLVVSQAVAVLGSAATIAEVSRLLDAPEQAVSEAVADLCGRGLAWIDDGKVLLPERLAQHWTAEIGGGRPAAVIARTTVVNDLRATASAWGVDIGGMRKPELIDRVSGVFRDVRAISAVVTALPPPVRDRLDQLRHSYHGYTYLYGGGFMHASAKMDGVLGEAGLLLRVGGRWEMPQEVGVAAWLAEREFLLSGPPVIPRADVDPAAVRGSAEVAAQDLIRAVTTLLDEARSTPIGSLKKGGVGTRERSRLASRLSLSSEVLLLAIDVSYAAGLLGLVEAGYVPTDEYPRWRDSEPGTRWARLVTAWFGLEHAPTSREIEDGKELPPPLPLASAAGSIRRAVLEAARDGQSVRVAGEHVDWLFPLHGYEDSQREDKVAAAIREAELLGVVAVDVLTEYGENLLAAIDAGPADLTEELARRMGSLLPETPCTVILQSDLTAMVSGQPSVAVSRLLSAAAVSEARGNAGVWRFSPASVRSALDAGWTAQDLVAELVALSDHPLPQPLEYLVNDVARRHGQVRVRQVRSCVVTDETMAAEILHTKALAKLKFAQVAPTVLTSPREPAEVLAKLRDAGLSPVSEDATGAVIIERQPEHRAPAAPRKRQTRPSGRLSASELAERLTTASDAGNEPVLSNTFEQLAELNPRLGEAELMLLSDAVDQHRDVVITYRNRSGGRTTRAIQPVEIHGRWLDSWCRLRDGQRDFTVANIESVAPLG